MELCKLKKDEIKERLPKLVALVANGQYICRKCVRVANDKKLLCKPIELKRIKG